MSNLRNVVIQALIVASAMGLAWWPGEPISPVQANPPAGNAKATNTLKIPAFTAYSEPNANAVRISERGVSGWKGPENTLAWFGRFAEAGELAAALEVKLPDKAVTKLRLKVGSQVHEAQATGKTEPILLPLGRFKIEPGYHKFQLESLNRPGQANGDPVHLILEGQPLQGAHFNLNPRRNAASVHLNYQVPKDTKVEAFYCEMTGLEDPVHTYYMACGWHRGYFGMQVNSPTERRIIFSVWDSGGEAVDRRKVGDENRVKMIAKGDGVYSGDFGNEGTGGHSHLKFPWKTGATQRFLVTAKPVDPSATIFSGYYFHPDQKKWILISSWKAPKEGGYLRGLYSFSENFVGNNGQLLRKALYGNQWIRTPEGKWIEITQAKFSHDPTGKSDRLDRFMGVEKNQFFLSHGGFVNGFTKYGEPFTRPATQKQPADLNLPQLPD